MRIFDSNLIINANRLKNYRCKYLIGRSELTRRAGISGFTYQKVENGGSTSISTMRKIIEGLGITIDQAKAFGLIAFRH
jgi:DNA-binding XRE family transcriptional regulator